MHSRLIVLLAALATACGGPPPPLRVFVEPAHRSVVEAFLGFTPIDGAELETREAPKEALGGEGLQVALALGLSCEGCGAGSYRISAEDTRVFVEAADVTGLQYGLTEALEAAGVRFFHPWKTHVPETLSSITLERPGEPRIPEMSVRGLHLHTLHPIEAYFDFWEPSEENLAGAKRTIDWILKNRGNYLQYYALNNVQAPSEETDAWRAHTRAILDESHARGVRVGVAVQLFGSANLQKAYNLLDSPPPADPRAQLRARLEHLLRDLPFDVVSISFGEFVGEEPSVFVDRLNLAVEVITELAPQVEIQTVVHVGDQPELRVTYEGETLLYYFLVKFADARVVPWVHTVFFYNLFDDAGGAYHHADFREHREYLFELLDQNRRVGYFPESAYWVAFDNSVPLYLPAYLRSRWLDLEEIRKARAGKSPLKEHGLFSSGWEWGYWQTDAAVLRMNYRHPSSWREPLDAFFSPWGEAGRALVDQLEAVGELQYRVLIQERVAPYLAGRDKLIDAGEDLGIIAAPTRLRFEDAAALSEAERIAFTASVLEPLGRLAEGTELALQNVESLELVGPFFDELRDGLRINVYRARFMHALYSAALEKAAGRPFESLLQAAAATFEAAKPVSFSRHDALHDPRGKRLYVNGRNKTLYPYGYLREARILCFWKRELSQARSELLQVTETAPACVDVDLG